MMVARNVGKKRTEAAAEIARFKDELELHDRDTVTPRAEFEDGKVVAITHFPSVVVHTQANNFGMRHVIPKGTDSYVLACTLFGKEHADDDITPASVRHAHKSVRAGDAST